MSRRSATFKEVSISLHSDSQQPSARSMHGTPTRSEKVYSAPMKFHVHQGPNNQHYLKTRHSSNNSATSSDVNESSELKSSSTAAADGTDEERKRSSSLSPFARLRRAKQALSNIAKIPKSPMKERKHRSHRSPRSADRKEIEAAKMQARIDDWAFQFKVAIELDISGDTTGAYDAYSR